ncbi:heat shock protein beta-7-like [Gopherus evgoodei]|uniref:heat shock protein beta-7-like n=1 Tax=Gopherus evgoodei TaxID=1825980 RepID=UPI0011CF3F9D|nr:heat shock protein beta-7-like [Gopherus evgoodei]
MASVSSSSTYRSERISTYSQNAPPAEPCFEPRGCFAEEGDRSSLHHGPFVTRARDSYGYTGSPGSVHPCSLSSNVRAGGDTYQVTADVSQFEPQDIVVTTYNYHIIIQAEKVAEDGTVSNTFTHKCQLPEDMDPMSVSCALTDAGLLVINAKRSVAAKAGEMPPPVYRTEVKL